MGIDGGDEGLARALAELEIRNLVARLAHTADAGEDVEEYGRFFTEDGAWEFPGGPRHGRADIVAGARERRAQGVTGPGSASRHVITSLAVAVEDPDPEQGRATADSYWLFFRETTTAPAIFNMGHYHDTIRREDGAWRIARRTIILG